MLSSNKIVFPKNLDKFSVNVFFLNFHLGLNNNSLSQDLDVFLAMKKVEGNERIRRTTNDS